MSSVRQVKETFLWWIGFVYFCAFASIYFQIPGLYGHNGILPVKLFLKSSSNHKTMADNINHKPTLLWLAPVLGCSMSEMMDILALGGIAISLFIMSYRRAANCFNYFILWSFYFSIYQVGQTFLHFQWDILLLEAGFLAVIVAPLRIPFFKSSFYAPHDKITLWLVKWLFFRLMFASGIVKLTSLCPTWWKLTALNYHFESQCIPTPLAWLFHSFPNWFLKLSVIMTYLIEIAAPFLFFSPVRSLRLFSYWCQVLLQVLIILTGNYNFFNLLTLTLAISLLDDKFLSGVDHNVSVKQESVKKRSVTARSVLSQLACHISSAVVLGGIVYLVVELFAIRIRKDGGFSAKINFSEKQFSSTLSQAVPITIWIAVTSLTAHIFHSIYTSLRVEGIIAKLKAITSTCIVSILVIFMFTISVVPHTTVDNAAYSNVWPVVKKWHSLTDKFELVHSYGLFRRMTGVGGRPEIVIEGSNSIKSAWKEYEFHFKPGNISSCPKFVAPHQPRLDWQMWFAALSNYHHNPWFINLINHLLEGRKEVLDLFAHNPFADAPPKFIRATLYTYEYTEYDPEVRRSSNWWKRKNPVEYMPVLTKDNPSLQEYLRQAGLEQPKPLEAQKTNISIILNMIRGILSSMSPPVFIWTVCLIAIIARFLS